ncbi:M56 family metallopeptidase [Flavobacterium sp. RHBU_3]|uniref:M56 family metallopeptidase n=1 Tax=Flavobacterium sp. RHBU_3 TaxID=3391184 RepID=UPI0039847E8B
METLLMYIIKASALLAVFYAAYYLLLKRETFFNANRAFLLAGLITSLVLPLVEYTKVIWVQPEPQVPMTAQQYQMLALAMKQQALHPQETPFNWWYVVLGLYATGILFLALRLLTDVFKIRRMLSGKQIQPQQPYKLVDSPEVDTPFSFFNYIVYNSEVLNPQELESIITHEKVHSKQKHSLDMLLAQAVCILFWFNPIVWLYKKAISQNLEFIADACAMKLVTDKKAYQKTMLRLSVQPKSISITNHFYQSLIKKRIVMLNTQPSRRRNSWKYAVVLPALAFFMLAFQVKTVAQEKESQKANLEGMSVTIDKNSTDEALEVQKKTLKLTGAEVTFSGVKRNKKGEIIAIKAELKSKGTNRLYQVAGNEPIEPFTISSEKDKDGNLVLNISASKHETSLRLQLADSKPLVIKSDTLYFDRKKMDTVIVKQDAKVIALNRINADESDNLATNGKNIAMNISDNTLVLVNGKKLPKGAPITLPNGQQIASVNVLKGKEAKKKYGKEAKDGAIEITTENTGNGTGFNFTKVPNGQFRFSMQQPEVVVDADHFIFQGDDFDMDMTAFTDLNGVQFEQLRDQLKAFEDMEAISIDLDMHPQLMERAEIMLSDVFKENGGNGNPADIEKMRADMQKARKDMEKMREEMQEMRQKMLKERQQMIKEREKAKQAAKKTRRA